MSDMTLCDRADDQDDELVASVCALKAGDTTALRRLAELSTFYARKVAARLVDDHMAAEDVAQEALLEALATLGQLRQPRAYRAWLRLVVRKHAERHRRLHHPVVSVDVLESLLADETMSPEPALERSAEADVVRRVLAMAPVSDRLLLSLKYLAEWPDAELARLMGTSEGALRKRLFDARRRLRPKLARQLGRSATPPSPAPKEVRPMSLEQLFGTIVTPDVSVAHAPPLHRPERYEALPTGFALIDTLVPIPRGGLVELRGGWLLIMLNELIGNMAALGPAVMVAVGTRRPDVNGVYARTHRLIELEATGHLVVVVEAQESHDADAVRAGGRLARRLAAEGNDVLLVVDYVVSEWVGPRALRAELGLGEQGSVTGLRLSGVVIDNRPATSPGAWMEADAVVDLSLSELVRGRFPAVDLCQSRSAVLDNPDLAPHHRRLAHQAHQVLAQAEALKVALSQSVDLGEGWIGHSSNPVDVEEALRQLDRLLPTD